MPAINPLASALAIPQASPFASLSLAELAAIAQKTTDPGAMQAIQAEFLRRQNAGQAVSPTFGSTLSAGAPFPNAVPPMASDPAFSAFLARMRTGTNPGGPAASGIGTNVLPGNDQLIGAVPTAPSPAAPLAAPGAAGGYGLAAQAPQAPPQPGPMDASIMSAPGIGGAPPPMDQGAMPPGSGAGAADNALPLPLDKPPQSDQMGIEGGWPVPGPGIPARRGAVRPPVSESDVLNRLSAAMSPAERRLDAKQISDLISARLAAQMG